MQQKGGEQKALLFVKPGEGWHVVRPNQKLHGMQTGRKTMRSDNEEKRKLSETDPQLTQPSKDIDDLNNTID